MSTGNGLQLSTGPVDLVLQDVAGCKLVQESVGDEESHERMEGSILEQSVQSAHGMEAYVRQLHDLEEQKVAS